MKSWLTLLFLGLYLSLFSQSRCASQPPLKGLFYFPEAGASPASEGFNLITIPIVVHILWQNAEENISDAQVQSQIDVLNRDFRALNNEIPAVPGAFANAVADMEVEFCLVAVSRTQTPFSGIANLYSGGKRRACHTELGGHDALNPENYLNIWACARNDGACGEGTFPNDPQVPDDEQGAFIRPDCFGTVGSASFPFNLGRTTTHEIGHYLNLKHLWGEGLEDLLCQSDDLVEDTEEQAYSYAEFTGQDCPIHPSFSCGTADMFMNFMNLPADRCMSMFTNGQKERARAAIQAYRPGLLEASCVPVAGPQILEKEDNPVLLGNPSSSEISLLLPQKDKYEIAIFDAAGRLVFSDFHASGTPYYKIKCFFISGIYYVKIGHGKKIHTKKLIIVR